MEGQKPRWQWTIELSYLKLDGDGLNSLTCIGTPLQLVSASANSTKISCTAETCELPPVNWSQCMAELAASVLVPYGAAATCSEPVITNIAELRHESAPHPAAADLAARVGISQRAKADEFLRVWNALNNLRDGDALRTAAQALRWSDVSVHANRPVDGFVFSWIACNALYRRLVPEPTSDREAVQTWIQDDSVLPGFLNLCTEQWDATRSKLTLLCQPDFVLRRGKCHNIHVSEDLEQSIIEVVSLGNPKTLNSCHKKLAKHTFLVIYALRNVVVHGGSIPRMRTTNSRLFNESCASLDIADLCRAAASIVQPVVRQAIKRALLQA